MRKGNVPAEEHSADDDRHQHDRALLADGVQEDLRDRLARLRQDRRRIILHAKEEAEDEAPAEDGGDTW
jgi:hypothetical protein